MDDMWRRTKFESYFRSHPTTADVVQRGVGKIIENEEDKKTIAESFKRIDEYTKDLNV